MNEMMWIVFGLANSALFCALARWAYGSWPWESRKAWHWTEGEIRDLRNLLREEIK